MTSIRKTIENCSVLNRVFAAYFMNECWLKEGINFYDHIPVAHQIEYLNKDGKYITEKDTPYGLKHYFSGRVELSPIDLESINFKMLDEFFDDNMRNKFSDVASYFANAVKAHEHCDFVFSSLPDVDGAIFDCIQDPETNFRSRLIIGPNLLNAKYFAVWEFNCLLMIKLRAIDDHSEFGKHYKDVDFMTDDEREKFNKMSDRE